jgi:hypothetical protein
VKSCAKTAQGLIALTLSALPIWAIPNTIWTIPSIRKLANECYSRGNQKACGKLAQLAESNDPMLRSQAVSFLEDQAVLTKVALEDEHDIVRRSAVANLTDQGTLAKIAVEDHDEDVRYAAAGKI